MNPLFCLKELISRAFERKWVTVCLFLLFLCSIMSGILFIKTPVFYDYHLKICDRFLDEVCYSDRSVFLICMERFLGNALFLLLIMLGGLHPAALVITTTTLAFRGYLFGGSLAIFFSVYRFSGALMCITLYLPIHLLLDVVFFAAGAITFCRAFRFSFCMSDLKELLIDFLLLALLVFAICLFEMILLGVLFHPIGNLM